MKLPMNRKMIGSANGANTVRAGATPSTMASTGPTSAVTASGSASDIHSTTIIARTAPSRCAGAGIGSGATSYQMVPVLESTDLEDALALMRRAGRHLARVRDENGDTTAVLFLEDIIEELVGEVRDATSTH